MAHQQRAPGAPNSQKTTFIEHIKQIGCKRSPGLNKIISHGTTTITVDTIDELAFRNNCERCGDQQSQ